MKTAPTRITRALIFVALPLSGLLCGWWLRGLTPASHHERQPALTAHTPSHSTSPASPTGSTDAPTLFSSENATTATRETTGARTLQRMLRVEDSDLVELIESIGEMTRLSDTEVRQAWAEMSARGPRAGWSSRMVAVYLVARLARLGEHVELTGAWNPIGDEYQRAFDAEAARKNPEAIRARLATGENVPDTQRRVYFTQAVRENPLAALELWLQSTPATARGDQAEWFGDALAAGGETREKALALLREKNANPESLPWLVASMAADWSAQDPAAVEKWISEPGQADIRDALLSQLIHTRGLANPAEAWTWSQQLPDNLRREALSFNAGELANHHPETGKQLLATLTDPADRAEAIKSFSSIHAVNQPADWLAWRATLAPAERNVANEAAFETWARQEPDEAIQWLGQRPAGETKNAMIGSMVRIAAEENTDLAIQMIRHISDPKTRNEAVTITLQSLNTSELEKIRAILAAAERPAPAQGG